jgi:putative phosphoribosyl transferase
MFRDREDGGYQLAQRLKERSLRDPVVLAIPRGGVATGAALARELGAELDVVLSRKLRAPDQPELAVGGVGEDGAIYLNSYAREALNLDEAYLDQERKHQMAEIARRKKLFRSVRPAATLGGRSVIVTDDGIATGSTMIAALNVLKGQKPYEVIVAVPVAPPERLVEIRKLCDEVVCLDTPPEFWAVGQFYARFPQVEDAEVVELLRAQAPSAKTDEQDSQQSFSPERQHHGRQGTAASRQ